MEQSGAAVDRIRPVDVIEAGRSGRVFVGVDDALMRRVTVKKVNARAFADPAARARLIREVRILSRLDHPHILRIHDYAEQFGEDVLTIEFFAGRTLRDALASKLDFARKVRVATAVASVLAVAHRHGVVHGELSLDSVIISDTGEIKVVDFASTCNRLRVPAEDATPPADVRAFGLLLRNLFGNGDGDVDALIESLVREAPSERETAADAHGRLQRLGRRRARRVRMAVAAVGAAFFLTGAVKYTADLARARNAALSAQSEAESQRARANELVGVLIGDLRDKLESVGRLEIMDATTAKALSYFASIRPEEISAAELSVNIEALQQVAETQLVRADVPGARKTVQQALSMAEAALRRYPDDLELQFAAASSHSKVTDVLNQTGDLRGALEHAQAYASITAGLVRRRPADLRFLRGQANAASLLATMYARGEDLPATLRELETAIAIQRRILSIEDSDDERFGLAINVHKAGLALLRLGRLGDARDLLTAEQAQVMSLLARRASHKRLRELQARFDDDLAMVALAAGDLPAALRHTAAHLETSRQLAAFEAGNVEWTRQVIIAHRTSGTAARMAGDVASALRHHQQSVDLLGAIFAQGKQTGLLIREMAWSRGELARTLLAAGRAPAALAQAEQVLAAFAPMRGEPSAQRYIADALLLSGEARAAGGDAAGATAAFEETVRILAPLDARSPDPRIADAHVRALLRLGRREAARPLIQELFALGYRNREFEALCKETGALINTST